MFKFKLLSINACLFKLLQNFELLKTFDFNNLLLYYYEKTIFLQFKLSQKLNKSKHKTSP